MYLSERLERVLTAIGELSCNGLLVDVGCDHGYICIEAVRRGLVDRALACDINPGPLDRARINIEAAGLSDRIETLLGDGLSPVAPASLKEGRQHGGVTVLMAGMGGQLIRDMLNESSDLLTDVSGLVLSPQSEPELVRSFIMEQGFVIRQEHYVLDGGKYYVIMEAARPETAEEHQEPYSTEELLFGRHGLERRDPVLRNQLTELKRMTEEALSKAGKGTSEKAMERKRELAELSMYIDKALDRYKEGEYGKDHA